MIFAAGFGTRMRPLTDTMPKPLIPVGGRPLVDHTLDLVKAVQPDRVVMNAHYRAPQLVDHMAGHPIKVLIETPQILDTGGGLRNALPDLGDGPVWTTNSDAIWDGPNPLAFVAERWDPDIMDALLVCVPLARSIGRDRGGDFAMDEDGRLSRGDDYVYGGVQILKPDGLHDIAEESFSLNVIWNQMQDRGRLFGCVYPGRWADVGHPAGIAMAESLLDG